MGDSILGGAAKGKPSSQYLYDKTYTINATMKRALNPGGRVDSGEVTIFVDGFLLSARNAECLSMVCRRLYPEARYPLDQGTLRNHLSTPSRV